MSNFVRLLCIYLCCFLTLSEVAQVNWFILQKKKLSSLREEVTYLRLQCEREENLRLDVNILNTYLSSLPPNAQWYNSPLKQKSSYSSNFQSTEWEKDLVDEYPCKRKEKNLGGKKLNLTLFPKLTIYFSQIIYFYIPGTILHSTWDGSRVRFQLKVNPR